MANKNMQCFFKIKVAGEEMEPASEGYSWRKDRDLGMRWWNSWVSLRAYSSGRVDTGQAGVGGRGRSVNLTCSNLQSPYMPKMT